MHGDVGGGDNGIVEIGRGRQVVGNIHLIRVMHGRRSIIRRRNGWLIISRVVGGHNTSEMSRKMNGRALNLLLV